MNIMTLYTDTKITFNDLNVVSSISAWHSSLPLLAVGSYNQDRGGLITIFQESGLALEGCEWPVLLSNQVTSLAWHPTRKLLVVGWDGGELYIWLEYSWARLEAPHNAALTTITFSPGGGRFIAADAAGSVSGWQSTSGAPLISFHHQLGDTVTKIAFCTAQSNGDSIRSLAKAAVAGDESALDALAAWRPKTTARNRENEPDNLNCYASQENGVILFINQNGSCSEVVNSTGNIVFMAMLSDIHLLVAWESGGVLSLTRFFCKKDGTMDSDTHVRLSSRNGQSLVLAGKFCLAVITGDCVIRLWDSETGDNDVLPNESDNIVQGDIFTGLSYCNLTETLCCGTSQGNLYFWRRDHKNFWKKISSSSIKGTIKDVSWGSEGLINPLLHVNCITSAFILREQPICWGYTPNLTLVQKSATKLELASNHLTTTIESAISIRALAFKDQYLAISNGSETQVWLNNKNNQTKFTLLHTFSWKTDVLFIHGDMLVGVSSPHLECRSVSGNTIGMLHNSEDEGDPIAISNTNKYLVIATMNGTLKLVEINRKGLRMPFPPKNCYQVIENFGEVMRISVNSVGKYICLSVANSGLAPDPKLYLWDAANDSITTTVLGKSSQPPYHSVPIAIIWDQNDPRFVAVHVRSVHTDNVDLYCCHEGQLYQYKSWSSDMMVFPQDFMLCSLYAPYVVILAQQSLVKILLNEFNEYADPEAETLRQILDFVYYMTIGNLEKAIVVGANITRGKNSILWDSLAKVCVAMKKPDIGAICLSKKGNIKGALMIRNAVNNYAVDDTSRTGILALNLGMLDEAENLFKKAKRTDLITKLISAKKGGLESLTEGTTEGENFLLLKSVQHKLAQELWASGDTRQALKLFESAGTLVPHVPRMLVAQGQANVLAQIVENSSDMSLILWWGHYLESTGDLDGALEAYARANDNGEQTRLLCHMNRFEEAEKLCSKSTSGTYQLARYLEMQPDKTDKTVKLYIKCGAISSAIRVAAESQDWNLVWRAGMSSPQHALHAAAILENAEQNDQAISLYQKAGKPHMALRLALQCNDTSAMIAAVETLGEEQVDPDMAKLLAVHLREAEQHSHAAALLATAGKYEEALDIVESTSTALTEELSERLSAPAGVVGREALLKRLADVLGGRGLYHQAAKRLTQAGDKAGAMRWLMRSGDVDRIATFAAASRDRTTQLMAADFLRRHADWRARPDLVRHILHFYTRVKAYTKLAAFYAECAKVEVDEYNNYEKALDALKEASRSLAKASDPDTEIQRVALQEQSTLVKRFLDIKRIFESGDINAGVTSAEQLLRVVSGNPGLISEEKVFAIVVEKAAGHPNIRHFEDRLKSLQSTSHEASETLGSPVPSIEEVV